MKIFITALSIIFTCQLSVAQNTGIGTITPEAKLHVNGDLKLQNGFAVNKFSRDSLFAENSDNNVPTEKAIKAFVKNGGWASPDSSQLGTHALVARGYADFGVGTAGAVAVKDTVAFVISWNSEGLSTHSVKDVYNPKRLDNETTGLTNAIDVAVSGNYAYVITDEINSKLYVYNISNPRNIIPVTNINAGREAKAIYTQGNFVYIVASTPRLAVYDVSNPAAPVARGSSNTNLSLANDVFVQGNYAYVASTSNNRFCIFDISNPDAVTPLGFTSTGLNSPLSVYVKNNYAYVSSGDISFNDIRIFNIADPLNIISAGNIRDVVYRPGYLRGSGNYLFAGTNYSNEIFALDISNPVAPVLAGQSSTNLSGAGKIFAAGETVYVPSYNNTRLCIYQLERNRQVAAGPSGLTYAPITWQTNGADIFRSNGFVGINTSKPKSTLHVEGSAIVNGYMSVGFMNDWPEAPLHLAPQLGQRLILWGEPFTGSSYGIGVQAGLLQMHSNTISDDIGFGYGSSTSFTERMRIKGNGQVGIGTSTPVKQTEIIGAASATPVTLVIGNRGGFGPAAMEFVSDYGLGSQWRPGYIRSNDTGGFTGSLEFYTNGTGSGNLYGNVKGLEVRNGQTLTATGAVGAYSDARLKENIQPFTDGLNVINKINPVQFTYNSSAPFASSQLQTGILAQELEKIAPYMVEQTTQNGFTDLRYVNNQAYTFLLINAVKEQQLQIAQQQLQLNQQQKEINAIKQLLQQLTQK